MAGRNQKKGEVIALSGPQHKAVMALAAGHLKKEAAEKAGVWPQAVSEWLKQPHFQVESLRGELVSHATLQLRTMTGAAVSRETLESGPPPARLRAAMYVLDRLVAAQAARNNRPVDAHPDISTEQVLAAIGFSE